MGHKAAETACNINKTFGPGTANERTVHWWFKRFCKGDESLEDEEHSGWPLEVDSDQIESHHQRWSSYTGSCQRTQHQPFYGHSAFEANGKDEKLSKWVPHELTKNLRKIVLKCHLLLFYTTTNHFSIKLWCVIKSGLRTTAGDSQLSGCTERKLQSTFQSQTCTRKKSWSLVVCCPSDPLQFSESWWNHYIWEVGSANWWDAPKTATPATGIGPQKGPSSSSWQHPTIQCIAASKVEQICLICHIHLTPCQPTTTFSSISATFCRENASTASRRQEMLCRSFSNPKAWISMLQQ